MPGFITEGVVFRGDWARRCFCRHCRRVVSVPEFRATGGFCKVCGEPGDEVVCRFECGPDTRSFWDKLTSKPRPGRWVTKIE